MSIEGRLQQHLLLIRRCVGWTAAEFGERIGVTRQTINNLESNKQEKYKLSKTQYLAIRRVLDEEMMASPEDMEMVQTILEVLIDHPEKYPEDEREKVLQKASMIAPSILAKSSSRAEVSNDWRITRTKGLLGIAVASLAFLAPVAAKAISNLNKDKYSTDDLGGYPYESKREE